MRSRVAVSRTGPGSKSARPTAPRARAAAAQYCIENFRSSPFDGRAWRSTSGTTALTPTSTAATFAGSIRWRARSSSSASIAECVSAHEGYGFTAMPEAVSSQRVPSRSSASAGSVAPENAAT